jgi:hypothetical protein
MVLSCLLQAYTVRLYVLPMVIRMLAFKALSLGIPNVDKEFKAA